MKRDICYWERLGDIPDYRAHWDWAKRESVEGVCLVKSSCRRSDDNVSVQEIL